LTVAEYIALLQTFPSEAMPKIAAAAIMRWAEASVSAPNGQPPVSDTGLLDAKQVAELWSVPETWVRDQARAGKLPSIQLGRYVRFRLSDLERFLGAKPLLRARRNGYP
jgi:excisionase family DNA binding protein